MQLHLKLEDLALFLLFSAVFLFLPIPWWWYPALILAPDIGMVGYLAGPRIGAYSYNLFHSRVLGVILIAIALPTWMEGTLSMGLMGWIGASGLIILAHASLDRLFGYGLKYTDTFKHTHLGTVGKATEKS